MSTPQQLMDLSAALLNDVAKSVFTYAAQLPYLNMALKELQEHYELNDVPISYESSDVISVPIGDSLIDDLPDGLIEIIKLWERQSGTVVWHPMGKQEILAPFDGQSLSAFGVYAWTGQVIRFYPSIRANQIKIDYLKAIFATITNANWSEELGVINSDTFLYNRTAALCAQFIGENKERADDLNAYAEMSLDRVTGISTKGRQSIPTRHRPMFRRR